MILGIYCAGGNGKTEVDLARVIQAREPRWEEVIFVDDVVAEKKIYETKVLTYAKVRETYDASQIEFTISIGEPAHRKTLFEKIKKDGYGFATLVHPDAWVPKGTKIGEGAILGNADIGSDAVIGDNTIVSQKATVGHDTIVGAHCNLSLGSFIAGHCQVGNEVYIGPMAAIRDEIHIDDTAVIAIGATIFKDVPGDVIALGNPAKYVKKKDGYRIFS